MGDGIMMIAMSGMRRRETGLSLIELLVGLAIGVFLIGGLATILFNSKKASEAQDSAARLQENARFAMEFLSYDLRMAGYFGCARLPGGLQGLATGTYGDAVQFSYADPNDSITLTSDALRGANTLVLSSVDGLVDGQDLAIGDCGRTEIKPIASIATSTKTVTLGDTLSRPFFIDDAVVRVSDVFSYTIQLKNGVPTLVRMDALGNDEELVEGVEFLRLLYGDGTGYMAWDAVTDWDSISSIKVGLLMRSISNYNPDDNTGREYGSGADADASDGPFDILDLSGVNAVDPPQGNLRGQRKVFISTIYVRNAL